MGKGNKKRYGGETGRRGDYHKRPRHDDPWNPPIGSKGFLITCDEGKAPAAQQEARNMLTEYYERLYPADDEQHGDANKATNIEAQIAQEVAGLNDKKQRVFHNLNTHNGAMVYVQLTDAAKDDASVVDICEAIVKDADTTKELKTRLCIRVIPVECVCSSRIDDIKAAAQKLVEPYFGKNEGDKSVAFAVTFESRGAGRNVDRMQIIDAVIASIKQPPHTVNLDHPEVTILVQMFKTSCCLAVVKNFREMCRFNLRELIRDDEDRRKDRDDEKQKEKARLEEKAALLTGASNGAEQQKEEKKSDEGAAEGAAGKDEGAAAKEGAENDAAGGN